MLWVDPCYGLPLEGCYVAKAHRECAAQKALGKGGGRSEEGGQSDWDRQGGATHHPGKMARASPIVEAGGLGGEGAGGRPEKLKLGKQKAESAVRRAWRRALLFEQDWRLWHACLALVLIPTEIESTIALDGSPAPILQSANKPISYRVKTCSNCGLESGGDVLLCSCCGSELSSAGRSKAAAVLSVPSDGRLHFTGMSPSSKQKSPQLHILEWFLVLFALYESGVFYVGYYLYLTRGSLSMNYSNEVSDWIYYVLRNGSALGILGYVLFRNSRWCQGRAAYSMGSENAMSKSEGLRSTRQDSGRVSIFELFLVLFVAFAGSIIRSFEVFIGHATIPDQPVISSLSRDVHQMLDCAGALGLLSYVLSRSSRGFQDLGLRWASRDVAVALPLALGSGLAYGLLLPITFGVAEIVSGDRPHVANIANLVFGTSISMATVLSAILIGFFEELIVRGYLMTEVRRFTGSIVFAIICSVAVQTSYHFYQGGPRALAHVGGFMVFAVYYAKTNRILPAILAHVAVDLCALVMYALRLT